MSKLNGLGFRIFVWWIFFMCIIFFCFCKVGFCIECFFFVIERLIVFFYEVSVFISNVYCEKEYLVIIGFEIVYMWFW